MQLGNAFNQIIQKAANTILTSCYLSHFAAVAWDSVRLHNFWVCCLSYLSLCPTHWFKPFPVSIFMMNVSSHSLGLPLLQLHFLAFVIASIIIFDLQLWVCRVFSDPNPCSSLVWAVSCIYFMNTQYHSSLRVLSCIGCYTMSDCSPQLAVISILPP